ncbi:hypothetical protein BH23PLA1_BH23PLA1_02500 [soil metagenome]
MLAWSLTGLGIGLAFRWARPVESDRPESLPGEPAWRGEAVVAIGLALWTLATLGMRSLLWPVKVMSDGPIYHLWFAARWWQEGRLIPVAAPFGESVTTYFPAVGNLWFTWLIVGWGDETLAKVGQTPFLLLALLATFGMARRLGAGATPSAVAACWFATVSPQVIFSFEPNVDAIFFAGYLLACYFFLRYGLRSGGADALALGALAAGGAFGSKSSGLVLIPPLLGLVVLVVLWRAAPRREKLKHLAILSLLPRVRAGDWYVRNAYLTGNPLYPLHVEVFGRTILAGWYGSEVMRFSVYYIDPKDWRAFGDLMLLVFDPRLMPVWLLALAGAWAIGLRRQASEANGRLDVWVWVAAGLALLNIAIYWGLVPYRTQHRFMYQAAALAALPMARLFDRARWLCWLGVALLALHVLTPQAWPWAAAGEEAAIPWDLSPGPIPWEEAPPDRLKIPNAFPAPVPVPLSASEWSNRLATPPGPLGEPAFGMARAFGPWLVGAASFLLAWTWVRSLRWPTPGRRLGTALAGLGWLALAALVTFPWGLPEAQRFYPIYPDYYRGWLALDRLSGREGARIAYSGTNLPYYLLGPGLRNEVRYVNINDRRGWLMHVYHREAIARGEPTASVPRPDWDRQDPDFDAWLDNLRAWKIDLLVVARHNPVEPWPIERQWADESPGTFLPVYGQAEQDPQFLIYRVVPARGGADSGNPSGSRRITPPDATNKESGRPETRTGPPRLTP